MHTWEIFIERGPHLLIRNNPFQIGAEYFGEVKDSIDINLIKMCCRDCFSIKYWKDSIDFNDSFFIGQYLNTIISIKSLKTN